MSPDERINVLKDLGTATLSDALDKLGLPGAVPGVLPLSDGFRVAGPAYTVTYESTDERGGTVGDFIDDVPPGTVIVIDNRGRLDCTVWGDIMTTTADHCGLAGTVIDGVCRDVAKSLDLGYPVFSRGRSMQTGKDRVRMSAVQRPVNLGRAVVEPNDLVLGDADGVVVIASRFADRVLDIATGIESAEDRIRDAVLKGSRLDRARRDQGYHALQTRDEATS
jgi:4-hydroxy-4-methyl-2-oxoglutarate aldolase